jgi:hypothetical protein
MKIKEDHQEIAKAFLSGVTKGGALGAASSIISGIAMTTTPITTLFGYITIGSSVAVAGPVVLTAAAVGAATFGTIAVVSRYRKIRKTNKLFKQLGG